MDSHFEFLSKIAKMGLDHHAKMGKSPEVDDNGNPIQNFDLGGGVLGAIGGSLINPGLAPVGAIAGSGVQLPGGGISGALGLTNNFQAGNPNITPGTNPEQLSTAYEGAQSGLNQTQNQANTLNPGVAQGAGAESALSGQLANEAAGTGPNPALSELNTATGQNINQTAALIGSQRGAGANPTLAAEQAARAGASTQQGAISQAATLQAQQQLAAQQQQAQLAATQVNQGQNAVQGVNQQTQNEQNILQGANTAYNNANVSATGNANTTNASVAAGNQKTNSGLIGGIAGGLSSAASSLFAHGGIVKMDRGGNVLDAEKRSHISEDNFALPGRRYPIHDLPHARNALARVSQYGTPSEKAKVKAAVHKKYPSMGVQKKAEGGEIEQPQQTSSGGADVDCVSRPDTGWGAVICRADGGSIPGQQLSGGTGIQPLSFVGQWLNSNVSNPGSPTTPGAPGASDVGSSQLQKQISGLAPDLSGLSGSGLSSFSDPASEIDSGDTDSATKGFDPTKLTQDRTMLAAKGGVLPGKPKVNHDDLKNDTIKAKVDGGGEARLTPGELVVDLNTLNDPGPVGKMARALRTHIQNKKGKAS